MTAYIQGVHMDRSINDTWDLASNVGATATMVAAPRAVATNSVDPLISDPFAELLVRAVGIDFFTRLACGELDPPDIDNDGGQAVQRMVDVIAVRTRFFDEFFAQAVAAGIRQAVILASGLDARAYRLHWPAASRLFEIDQPEVVAFKTRALTELGAAPTTNRGTVAADLRQDWPAALRRAGFRTDQPTAWIAEGLLGYMPPEAQDRLLDNVNALSARGSRFAAASVPNLGQRDQDHFRHQIQLLIQRWQNHGFNVDMTDMVYLDDHNDIADHLGAHGWQTVAASTSELFLANGLDPIDEQLKPHIRSRRIRRICRAALGRGVRLRPLSHPWGAVSTLDLEPSARRLLPWAMTASTVPDIEGSGETVWSILQTRTPSMAVVKPGRACRSNSSRRSPRDMSPLRVCDLADKARKWRAERPVET